MTHDEQVKAINAVNPNVEILEEITGNAVKVLCRCKICNHKWSATPNKLKSGKGCPECKKVKIGNAKRKTHDEHVAAIAKVNPNIEVLGEIIGNKAKVLCRCLVCGHKWEPAVYSLKKGKGCPACAGKKLTHADHVAAIARINPNIEVLGKIKNVRTKVLCRCKVCRYEWEAMPSDLKRGGGCPRCKRVGRKRLPHAKHVAAIKKVNPNIEVLEEIKHVHKKVLCRCIICSHKWSAAPSDLKKGCGCPQCAKTGFLAHDVGKLYIMVDNLELPTMMKIGVSVREDRSKQVLRSAHKAGVIIPALYVVKTWEGPTELMHRIEGIMHENYAEWNIKFPAKFSGCTEFFYYTPETAEAFDIIEETYHEIINANQAA